MRVEINTMKKLIPVLLVVLLMVGLLPTVAFAEGVNTDTIKFNGSYQATSEKGIFELNTTWVTEDGWCCGGTDTLTIRPTQNGITITRIDVVLGFFGEDFPNVLVSSGTKSEGEVGEGDMVSVTEINSPNVSFYGNPANGAYVYFKDITVYYNYHKVEIGANHVHTYICECGDIYIPDGTASTLSEGNMTIVVGVACLALGLVGGLLIGKKKKNVAANGKED